MAGNEVGWLFTIAIKEGQRDAVETLFAEMAAYTKETEPGALVYEMTISEDGTTGHVEERYQDSAAGLAHMESFGKNFAARLFELAKPTGMYVSGEPDATLRGALDQARAIHMKPAGGFTR